MEVQAVIQDSFFDTLNEALRDAIRKPDKLAYFLRSQFGKRLTEIVSLEKDYVAVVAAVVDSAEAEGWVDDLIRAALQEVPGNVKLRSFAQQVGLLPSMAVTVEQEATVVQANPFLDMDIWKSALSEVELRVCRVKTPETYGTGFLVGPDLILTSYHVMEPVLKEHVRSDTVRFIFDHKKLANGETPNGTTHRLGKLAWLQHASPPSLVDSLPDSVNTVPQADELDFALVRTALEPGNDEMSGKGKPNARKRGWIDLSVPALRVRSGAALIIAQYPVFEPSPGRFIPQPLAMTVDTQSVIALNMNETRLRYRTNTAHGTSGAPCFTINWEPVALHRGGSVLRNDGIPLSAIQTLLKEHYGDKLLVPYSDAR